jgi:hypothetical protein
MELVDPVILDHRPWSHRHLMLEKNSADRRSRPSNHCKFVDHRPKAVVLTRARAGYLQVQPDLRLGGSDCTRR